MTVPNLSVQIPPEDVQLFNQLKKEWDKLYNNSLYRSLTMEPAKKVFAKTTTSLIAKFIDNIKEFVQKFYDEGPLSENLDLEPAFLLMDVSIITQILCIVSYYGCRFDM